jgi:hypothetical protein
MDRKGLAPMTLKLAARPPTTTCQSLPPDGTIFSLGDKVAVKDLRTVRRPAESARRPSG